MKKKKTTFISRAAHDSSDECVGTRKGCLCSVGL